MQVVLRRGSRFALIGMLALIGASCSEEGTQAAPSDSTPLSQTGAIEPKAGDGSVVSQFAGEEWFLGTVPDRAEAADSSRAPIKVGMINIDDAPLGALPELTRAMDAGVKFINTELGGVRGAPIELVKCSVDLSPEKSQACARKMVEDDVIAVVPGINIMSNAAVPVLEQASIPIVGGIPVNEAEMVSPLSFQFSGGSPGAFVAFVSDAHSRLQAKKIVVSYANLPQIGGPAQKYGSQLARDLGIEVVEVPFDLGATDMSAVIQRASAEKPDAIMVSAADASCATSMNALADLSVTVPVYMVGSCADQKWLEQVGVDRVKNIQFAIEGRLDQTVSKSADTELYRTAMAKYSTDVNAAGAATVAFRSLMNLYGAMIDSTSAPSSQSLIDYFRAARAHPNFDGHPYTCDGKQIPELPSMCSPQEVLVRLQGPGYLDFVESPSGWVDVPAVIASARGS